MENYHYDVISTENGTAIDFYTPVAPIITERAPVGPCGLVEGQAYRRLQEDQDNGRFLISFLAEVSN